MNSTTRTASARRWLAGRRRLVAWAILAVVAAGGSYVVGDWYCSHPADAPRRYVGRATCAACHPAEAAAHAGSDHDRAMQPATEATVLAAFDGREQEHEGVRARFFREGESFRVETEGGDGRRRTYVATHVFGVRPLQQYLVAEVGSSDAESALAAGSAGGERSGAGIGRLQAMRWSWDVEGERWFHLDPPDVRMRLQPDDPLHWTGLAQCWNTSCASCHSTHLRKNFDPQSQRYATTFEEIDVSCEACHGPGSLHVELASAVSLFWDRRHGRGLVSLKGGVAGPQVDQCGACHARRGELVAAHDPSLPFDEQFQCTLLERPTYHVDGQIRDEDFEYGSFLQSRMFQQGIACTDCHDPHSTKVRFADNRLCTSCHQHPAARYDSPAHHHHGVDSPGARCVECHMPATVYMDVDARRDHSLRVPRPDLSRRFGVPNACSRCHWEQVKLSADVASERPRYQDGIEAALRGDASAAAELDRLNTTLEEAWRTWYPPDQRASQTPWYEGLAELLSREGGEPHPDLTFLIDRRVPAIVRASGLAHVAGWEDEGSLHAAWSALEDSDAKVVVAGLARIEGELVQRERRGSIGGEYSISEEELHRAIAERLSDRRRRVRLEAARIWVGLPAAVHARWAAPASWPIFERAFQELVQSLEGQTDRAAGQHTLGSLWEQFGDLFQAVEAYGAAIAVEPGVVGPRSNWARLLEEELSRHEETLAEGRGTAEEIRNATERSARLREAISALRAEEHRLLERDAGYVLESATPGDGSEQVLYRFALSCYLQGDTARAEEFLRLALELRPNDEDLLFALASLKLSLNEFDAAEKIAVSLVKLAPREAMYRGLIEEIRRSRGGARGP